MVLRIGILFSGNGTNMMNLIEASKEKKNNYKVMVVISDNPEAEGLKNVKNKKIKTIVMNPNLFNSKKDFENNIHKKLMRNEVDIICLAGYMRVLGKKFLNKWKRKVINIHPSLLPSFKGLNAVKQALDYGVKFSGCTTHFVNENLDGGEIIDQSCVNVDKNETVDSLTKKILKEEHKLYINTVLNLSYKR
tara:strand:- start:141 stop:713 length:573 start_codon:yes stop_codon:yes gene_type:complete